MTAALPRPLTLVPGAIVLTSGFTAGDGFFLEAMRQRGVAADVRLRPIGSKALRALRRLHLHSPMHGKSVWRGRWSCSRKSPHLVVVHGADPTLPAALHAARLFPEARVVFAFWNPAGEVADPRRAARHRGIELWSFDPHGCLLNGMTSNTQFVFREIAQVALEVAPEVDHGFLGADKGRASALSRCQRGRKPWDSLIGSRWSGTGSQLTEPPLLEAMAPLPYPGLPRRTCRHGRSSILFRTARVAWPCAPSSRCTWVASS